MNELLEKYYPVTYWRQLIRDVFDRLAYYCLMIMQPLLPTSHRLSIQNKFIGLSVLICVGIVAFLIFFYQSFSLSLEDEKKVQTKNMSASAIGIIQYFHTLSLSGELSPADAQHYAMNAVRSAIYGDNGYFWINSCDGELLMQPHTPERVGINQIDWTDVNGQFIFREFVSKAKEGGGWVSYHWPKPESDKEFPKISYVAYFAPWDWVLGTGVYLDDMQENIFWVIAKASGILFAGFLVFVVAAFFSINYFVRQLSELAVRDGLTDLYTKRFLNEVTPSILNKHLRLTDHRLAAIFIDIDHFKKVNDTYGHKRGDIVLKKLATVMEKNTRPDDYCIRYGGEEFLLIGFFNDELSAVSTVERIRTETSKLVFNTNTNTDTFHITLSAGIAIHDSTTESFEETLERADKKLYESKAKGRNCVSV